MKRVFFVIAFSLPFFKVSVALEDAVYKKILDIVYNRSKEGWEYSGSGGYIFKFKLDVAGSDSPETFFNLSIENASHYSRWFVFIERNAGYNTEYLGELHFPGFAFNLANKNQGISTLLKAYQTDSYAEPPFKPFGKYIVAQQISDQGIESHIREVGSDASEEEHRALINDSDNPEGVVLQIPNIEFISLQNLLLDEDSVWYEYRGEDWVLQAGHLLRLQDVETVSEIRTTSDEARIKELIGYFTPELALELLEARLRANADTESDFAYTAQEPSAETAQEQVAKPLPVQPRVEEPAPSERCRVWPWLVGAVVLVLAGGLMFKRRKRNR